MRIFIERLTEAKKMKTKLLNENEREILYLEIEKSKINREKAAIILNKSLVLYFIFTLIAVIGFVAEFIDHVMMNILIIMGIVLLFIGTIPYYIMTRNEERKIDNFLKELKGEK